MASGELKIVLEDVKEKFDTVIDAVHMVRVTVERHEQKNDEQFKKIDMEFLEIKKDIRELRQNLTDHRDNTDLHTGGKRFNFKGISWGVILDDCEFFPPLLTTL